MQAERVVDDLSQRNIHGLVRNDVLEDVEVRVVSVLHAHAAEFRILVTFENIYSYGIHCDH